MIGEVEPMYLTLVDEMQTRYYPEYKVDVSYNIRFKVFMVNLSKETHCKGLLYDFSLNRIKTPILDRIEDSDNGLVGVVGENRKSLVKKNVNEELIYEFE